MRADPLVNCHIIDLTLKQRERENLNETRSVGTFAVARSRRKGEGRMRRECVRESMYSMYDLSED